MNENVTGIAALTTTFLIMAYGFGAMFGVPESLLEVVGLVTIFTIPALLVGFASDD